MYRFVALAWHAGGAADEAAALIAAQLLNAARRPWQSAYRTEGLLVWHADARAGRMQSHLLDDDRGVVLGQLFRKSADHAYRPQTGPLGAAESARCVDSRGRYLVDNFWGRYVAFLRDPASARLHVMRDPGAAFPCFFTQHGGIDIFFSDVEDVSELPFLRFSVNYDYLIASALLPAFQKTITGLREVGEVLPAQSIGFGPAGGQREFLWDPFEVADRPITDRREAVSLLHDTVHATVAALAGGYDRILHNIGGLDSSIILSCLAQMENRPDIGCVNFATASPRGDERYYCRQAAAHAGVPLTEGLLDADRVDLRRLFECDLRVAPMAMFDCTAPAGDLYGLAEQSRAEALFYGVGGDNVFFQLPYVLSALDYVRSGRGSANFGEVVVEASRYGHKSLLYTLRAMLKERIRPEPCFDYVYNLLAPTTSWPLLNPDLVAAGPRVEALHPLLVPKPDMAKGKYFHLLTSALLSPDYYDQWPSGYAVERIHPLMAQPVVELCLRIPSWILVHGGIDRGLARMAFREDLPPAVARRTSKSSPDELYETVYRENRGFIREILLDGELIRQGLVMKAPLETMLAGDDLREKVTAAAALEFLSWEIWIQKWAAHSSRR